MSFSDDAGEDHQRVYHRATGETFLQQEETDGGSLRQCAGASIEEGARATSVLAGARAVLVLFTAVLAASESGRGVVAQVEV